LFTCSPHRKCDEVKPAEEFYHIKSSSDGLASNCKACAVKIANATRKHFNPEPTVDHKVRLKCGNTLREPLHCPCFFSRAAAQIANAARKRFNPESLWITR